MAIKSLFLTEKIGYQDKDDTNLLISESVNRFETFAFRPESLSVENGKIFCLASKVLEDSEGSLVEEEKQQKIDISSNCYITIRLNPPFNISYITSMYLLAKYAFESTVLNDPLSIINFPEKIIPKEFYEFMPDTLITKNKNQIIDFWEKHSDIVIKPLYEFGGRSIFLLKKGEKNYKTILEMLFEKYDEPLMVQKFIPEVSKGDKRIFLLDGEVVGQYDRIPPQSQLQAAIAAGGTAHKADLTEKETKLCQKLKPILRKNKIMCCGVDTIGNSLTEINVTCPAGFKPVNQFFEIASQVKYWDIVCNKYPL